MNPWESLFFPIGDYLRYFVFFGYKLWKLSKICMKLIKIIFFPSFKLQLILNKFKSSSTLSTIAYTGGILSPVILGHFRTTIFS